MSVVLLAGGTGGARLARGLVATTAPESVTVVTNTADDDEMHSLPVSPDTDSVLYHLAGCFADDRGFGIAGDSFAVMAMLEQLGEPAWFRLGDRDIAVQLVRRSLLASGCTPSEAAAVIGRRLGVGAHVVPMSDEPVRTRLTTSVGELSLQEWFVRERCVPAVQAIRYAAIETARLSPAAEAAVRGAECVIVGPSNPVLSIDPIRALLGAAPPVPVVAVSPLVGGHALKGPTAHLLPQLGIEPSAIGVARHYAGWATDVVIDRVDASSIDGIAALGVRPHVADIVMRDMEAERELAAAVLRITAAAAR